MARLLVAMVPIYIALVVLSVLAPAYARVRRKRATTTFTAWYFAMVVLGSFYLSAKEPAELGGVRFFGSYLVIVALGVLVFTGPIALLVGYLLDRYAGHTKSGEPRA